MTSQTKKIVTRPHATIAEIKPDIMTFMADGEAVTLTDIEMAVGKGSRATIRRAVDALVDDGVLTRERGAKKAFAYRVARHPRGRRPVRKVSESANADPSMSLRSHIRALVDEIGMALANGACAYEMIDQLEGERDAAVARADDAERRLADVSAALAGQAVMS